MYIWMHSKIGRENPHVLMSLGWEGKTSTETKALQNLRKLIDALLATSSDHHCNEYSPQAVFPLS